MLRSMLQSTPLAGRAPLARRPVVVRRLPFARRPPLARRHPTATRAMEPLVIIPHVVPCCRLEVLKLLLQLGKQRQQPPHALQPHWQWSCTDGCCIEYSKLKTCKANTHTHTSDYPILWTQILTVKAVQYSTTTQPRSHHRPPQAYQAGVLTDHAHVVQTSDSQGRLWSTFNSTIHQPQESTTH